MRTMSLLVASVVATSCLAGAASRLPPLNATRWVNSGPLTPEGLRGKVVLVDVWEYTCINWIRTLPYTKAWNRDYASLGLVVIGVHSPEFEFGKRAENVDAGIRSHGLTYPIAIDNDFAIWRALDNDAWPAKYLFDRDGRLVKRWIGEGSYHEIEGEIRKLLAAGAPDVRLPPVSPEATAFARTGQRSYAGITGETYLGADRRDRGRRNTGRRLAQRTSVRRAPERRRQDRAPVQRRRGEPGHATWILGECRGDCDPRRQAVGDVRGADVGPDGVARFNGPRMIRLVAGAGPGRHVLTLVSNEPGLRAFAFTFGP